MSQRSPVIYETRVDVADDESIAASPGGGMDERAFFTKYNSTGKGLTQEDFASVLASYVDAEEATA